MDERVGIYLKLYGLEDIATVEQFQRLLNGISKRKYRIQFQSELGKVRLEASKAGAELEKARRKVKTLKSELSALKGAGGLKENAEQASRLKSQIERAETEVTALKNRQKDLNTEASLLSQKYRQAIRPVDDLNARISKMRTNLVQVGSQLQTLGKTMTNATNMFVRPITGALMGLGYSALNKVFSGFSGAFERYDTMHTYSTVMEALGYDAEQAQRSVEELNEAVLGLPTGLDEIIEKQKVFTVAANDMEKGTQLAIAANNAVVAGGMDAKNQQRMEAQLQRLLTTGELTAKQWRSLIDSAPLAISAVAEEMGYATDDFVAALTGNDIDPDAFIDAFINQGTNGRIYAATEEMKHTFSAAGANIENAVKRNVAGIIEELDKVLIAFSGKDVIDTIISVKDWINGLGDDIKSWIQANPERITNFLESLKSINVKGFLGGLAEELLTVGETIVKIINAVDDKVGLENVAKYAVRINILGRVMTLLGGVMKGSAGILSGAYGMASRVFGKAGFFSKITKFFKGSKAAAKAAGGAANAGGAISKVAITWQGVASKAVSFAGMTAIMLALKPAAEALKTLGEIDSAGNVAKNGLTLVAIVTALSTVATVIGGFAATGIGAVGLAVGAGVILAMAGSVKLAADGIKEVVDAVEKISEIKIPSTSRIELIGTAIKTIYDALAEVNATTRDSDSAELMADIMGSVEDIGKSLENIDALVIDFNTIGDKLENLGEAAQAAHDAISTDHNVLDYFDTLWDSGRAGNLEKIIGDLADIGDTVKRISKQSLIFQEITVAIATIRNLGTFMNQLDDAIEDAFEGLNDNIATGRWDSYFLETTERMTNIFNAIDEFGTSIKSADTTILREGLNITEITDKLVVKIEAIKRSRKKIFEAIRGFFTHLSESGQVHGGAGGTTEGDATTRTAAIGSFQSNIDSLKTIIDSVSSFVTQLKLLWENLKGVKVESIIEKINKKIAKFAKLDFSSLQEVNGGDPIDISIKADLNADVSYENAIQSVVDAIALVRQNLNMDDATSLIKQTIHVMFEPDIPNQTKQYVIDQTRAAIEYIRTQITAMYAWITKTVYVQLVAKISGEEGIISQVSNAVSRAERASTGGYISRSYNRPAYRAKGGSIFKRKGTDTVPAMLTPGEYVMKRKAVSEYGVQFMQRLNNLDIAGAMRALSLRKMDSFTPAGITNNKVTNKNNNARVTQNFYGDSNPDYAFKIANRYLSSI